MEANGFLRQFAKIERIKSMQGRAEYKKILFTNK
jgi:hypothetical protein